MARCQGELTYSCFLSGFNTIDKNSFTHTHKASSGWVSKLNAIAVLSVSLSSVLLQKLQHVVSKSGCHRSRAERV